MNTKDFAKRFNNFMNAPETIAVDFENATRKEKIAALEKAGAKIDDGKKYAVTVSRSRSKYETDADFIKVIAQIAPEKMATIFDNTGKVRQDCEISVKVWKRGDELTEAEKLNELSKQAKIEGGKIELENLGGQNFVEFVKYAYEQISK